MNNRPLKNAVSATQVVSQRPVKESGFTLLEVLVAFLILALSMAVLMRIVSQGLDVLGRAERHQVALQLAESRLVEVIARFRPEDRGTQEGRLSGGYRWRSEIEPFWFDNQEAGERYSIAPWQIRVSVSWGRRPGERVTLSTVRLVREAP